MNSIAVVSDSGSDLPPALLEAYRIGTVPLIARFGDYELHDRPESRAEFWERYDLRMPPQSSGPSVGAWADAFEAALQRASEVVAITITGKHSGTFNSAAIAANDFGGRIHLFDSWSISLGEGLLTLHAAALAAAGQPATVILDALAEMRRNLRLLIVLDTIEAVQRGGRLASVMTAIKRMSSLLSIKPLLTLDEGVLQFAGATRSMKQGIQRLVDPAQGRILRAAAIAHTRAPELADRLADAVAHAANLTRADILVAEAGPPLAVHAGPGALGLAIIPA